jgi:peptide-methionine (R)-S-oxide reductase
MFKSVRRLLSNTMSREQTDRAVEKTDEEWKSELTGAQYRILRECGTEPRGTSDLLDVKEDGTFRCAGCGAALFRTDEKFESGTGWPSFWDAVDDDAVETKTDRSHGMTRTEVVCRRCGGHLGHVFDDGPEPTGKRYCINGVALEFDPAEA